MTKINAADFKNKKVLVVGLGALGGGVATTKWFVKQGATVTVTDMRPEVQLGSSIDALGKDVKKVKFALGGHHAEDFEKNDFIVVNPAVPRESPFLQIARRAGKIVVNDARIFFDTVKNPIVAVTGTRGKTTTTNWIAHFLQSKDSGVVAGGNAPEMPLLLLIDGLKNKTTPAVVELSSWQLELMDRSNRGPNIAVITNLYPDHLNRYESMKDYALAKANIFTKQTKDDVLILNVENTWTKFFLKQKPRARIYFFSKHMLPSRLNGVYSNDNQIYFQENRKKTVVVNNKIYALLFERGPHNLENFLASALAVYFLGISWNTVCAHIRSLPEIRYREEVILRRKNYSVVNDSAGTSPDAAIVALRRFKDRNIVFIAGGTDKKLEFGEWAKEVRQHVKPDNLYFLDGSATEKMVYALCRGALFSKKNIRVYHDLETIIQEIGKKRKTFPKDTVILFSPGAASFEKFKNEFDRGEKFNVYSSKFL